MDKQKKLLIFFKKKDDNLKSSISSKSPRLEYQNLSQSPLKSHVTSVKNVNILERDSELR